MSKKSFLSALPLFGILLGTVNCTFTDSSPDHAASGEDAAPPATQPKGRATGPAELPSQPTVTGKVDLLFVVDNSPSMADKQNALVAEIDNLYAALPVTDLHVGVISSSLGEGGDVCPVDAGHPHSDDKAHLLNHGLDGNVVPGAERGFLSFGPGGISDYATLANGTKSLIQGVTESGCGLEAQLEAMYRFVAMPDPPASITLDNFEQASYTGVDYELLAQRKAFFRPDSTVAIIVMSDEDDGSLDPRGVGGFGYAFARRNFPGSAVRRGTTAEGTTAPKASSACATSPTSSDCTSCGFASNCDPQNALCATLRSDPSCTTSDTPGQSGPGIDGYWGPAEDDLNVRMFDMKQRFGVDPRYPVDRYVAALTSRLVPDRNGEQDHVTNCQNPLFAGGLPEKDGDQLCQLPDNQRPARSVFLGVLGGVPTPLLANGPDWTKLLGADPDAFDFGGIDPHMIPSTTARSPLGAADGEWDTQGKDLQYACTFPLPKPHDCTDPSSPVCQSGVQVRAKAYPTTRELTLAKRVGDQATVGSLCDVDGGGGYAKFLDAFGAKVLTGLPHLH
jgi:hypothetical protein